LDHQVKIRGFRIELGEIESRLLEHPMISEVVVAAQADNRGSHRYLCAYFAAEMELSVDQLREHLANHLPDYMIPSYFVQLEKMPLTANGKIDRRALPAPDVALDVATYQAPVDYMEEKLVALWAGVLDLEPGTISVDADFFQLGGHSLKATILAAGIHKELDVKISLTQLFASPTVRGLANYIRRAEQEKHIAVEPAEQKEYYALSSAQKRLYILQGLVPGNVSYNMPVVVELEGNLDEDRLEDTLKKLIARHDSLRSSFDLIDNVPVQVIHCQVEFEIHSYEGEPEQVTGNFVRPFDLGSAPLLRVGLLKEDENKHILMVDMHHIISDGTSMGIFTKEFMALYAGEELAPLRLQYKDFSQWQSGENYKQALAAQEEYWLKTLAGEIPVLELPTDYPRPLAQSFEGNTLSAAIGEEDAAALRSLAAGHDATLYMVLLAIFNMFLSKLGGQEDIIVGAPIAGRRHSDLQDIIGMFVNTLVLRNYPEGEKSAAAFLNEVKERTLAAYENQDYLFEDLVEKIDVNRDASRNPLFDVMFTLQNLETGEIQVPGLALKPYPFENKIAKFDLTVQCFESEQQLFFTFEYSARLFKRQTIERFMDFFKKIIHSVLADPQTSIAHLELIDDDERRRVLYEFNDTGRSYETGKTIDRLFAEQAERTPDRAAVIGAHPSRRLQGVYITYRELNENAGRLAVTLREKGACPGAIVAIKMEQSSELIISIMAVLKSGAAYLPIDPLYPQERIDYMLNDSNARLLVTKEGVTLFHHPVPRMIPLPGGVAEGRGGSLAYVIYTSGTTGRPRGVMVTHGSLLNLCRWHNEYYGVTEADHASKYAGIAFDASVWEIFPYLLEGAALYIIDDAVKADVERLNEYYETHDITIAFLPTQFCELFMEVGNRSLRRLLTGGDKLRMFKPQGCQLYNNYGPTENTVVTTVHPVEASLDNIPIGKPIANTRIYILDNHHHHVQPIGIVGELCIAGSGLAAGYLNQPELTHEKFFQGARGRFFQKEKLYKTGDLARWLPDGVIQFMGRLDHQVKIRGFRVELAEIENRLLEHPSIKAAAVMTHAGLTGDMAVTLCAYIVPREGAIDAASIRDHLLQALPLYMIPPYFIQLAEIPLTPNGKVNRQALPIPDASNIQRKEEYIEPETEMEKTIAEIWQEVLNLEKIGIDDNFFDIGGNSLNIMQVNKKVNQVFNTTMSVVEMFRYPTIRLLAQFLSQPREASSGELDRGKRTRALERGKDDRKQRLQKRKQIKKKHSR
jgi:surfactin family lipopeptide synthetase A/lichenysin synthetase A